MSDSPLPLQQGWVSTTVGEITSVDSGIGFPEIYQGKKEGDFPFYKVMDISKTVKKGGIYLTKSDNYISLKDFKDLKAKLIKKDSLVFAKIGAAIALNRRAILSSDALVDNNIMAVNCDSANLDGKYIYYFFLTIKLGELSRATTVPSIRKSDVENISMPLPPFKEQHRIVTKIEELFTQLDAGVASLKKVQAQLKRYRQAVLKAAFEGRLTQEWREEHKGEIEPADILIKCIEQDRDNFSKISTKKHVINHPEELPNLSEGWVWAIVNQILQPNRICSYGVLQPGNDLTEGIRLIRVGDIDEGKIAIENLKRISPIISGQYPRTLLEGDEVLMTLVGAIGRTAVVPKSLAGANVARAVGVIPVSIRLNPKWVELWFRYPPKVAEMTSKSHEVARKTLNLEDVRAAYVAIPPKEEQDKAVSEIERLFSIADEVELTLSISLRQAETLRQSILKRAFEGKLVPQDPNDEPASILLDRIKAEKARHATETKKGKTLQPKSPKRKVPNGN